MGRELYQLVAIDKNQNQYIIELKNDNKNDKGNLEFIDRGTVRFKDKESLAEYLYKEGKIPTTNVKFKIKYKHNGDKYLPVIYNSSNLSMYIDYDKLGKFEYSKKFLSKIKNEFESGNFFDYICFQNKKFSLKKDDGNYIDNRLFIDLCDYYVLCKTNKSNKEKDYLIESILKELSNYKQYRTLYNFLKKYNKLCVLNIYKNAFDEYEKLPNIPDVIRHAYETNGMDGVYSIIDRDDLELSGLSNLDELESNKTRIR